MEKECYQKLFLEVMDKLFNNSKNVLKTLRSNRYAFSVNDLEKVNNFINSCLKDKISNV